MSMPDMREEAVGKAALILRGARRAFLGAGFGAVPGRTFHCAMEVDGSIAVFDIWESMAELEKFTATLGPIMDELGADPGAPQVSTIHNVKHG